MTSAGSSFLIRTTLACALVLCGTSTASAQVPTPGTPAATIQQQITGLGLRQQVMARIQTSGLTPDAIRQRLASMGYDPRTLDVYMDSTGGVPPEPTPGAISALRGVGLLDAVQANAGDTRPDPAPMSEDERRRGLRVFGIEVFARGSSQFDPVTFGALPSTYQLGPGDELVLVITGDVEFNYQLPVNREGAITIPQVGQIYVNGLTLASLRDQLYSRLGRVYSGVSRSPGAPTQFSVSVSRTRTNQISIVGDVARPGTYTVSPLASVLNALYQAGGPTSNGSFRDVRVMRGGALVQSVDLYRYLLSGDNLSTLLLEPGDVLFVPVHGRHVSIQGEVNREAIYELRPQETLGDLITFAGGLTAPAYTRRARITRILPPVERRDPGVDRTTIDLDLDQALQNPAAAPTLRAGDAITVFSVLADVRRTVTIGGGVWREGSYAYTPGMRAWDVIAASDGLREDAFLETAHISRIDRASGTISVIPFSLARAADGTPVANPQLMETDLIRIFTRSDQADNLPIEVVGAVRRPGSERFQKGMTLRDAIIRSGGLNRLADPVLEISRIADVQSRAGGQIATLFKVRVDSTYFVSDEAAEFYMGDPAALAQAIGGGEAATFALQPHDRVFVRFIPELELPRVVTVMGEARYPGAYTLRSKNERLREMIMERSGGLTQTAYAEGIRLVRNGAAVKIDVPAVLRSAEHDDNVILEVGDVITIPAFNPVVTVRGAVNAPAAMLYRGDDLSYYIESAGGLAERADDDRIHIQYANGGNDVVKKYVFFTNNPRVEPGSTITVPFELGDRTDVRGLVSDVLQIVASLATVLLAIRAIN